jgi:hypothetical protein
MMRGGGAVRALVHRAPDAKEFAPGGGSGPGIEPTLARFEPPLRFRNAIGRHQRFARGQLRLDRLCRRDARGVHQRLGVGDGFVVGAPANRQLHAEHLQRPLVPPHRLGAVRAVGFARLAEVFGGTLVGSTHQVDLGERIEDGAGRLLELHRAADFQRAGQDLFRALQVPELHQDLAERRERDGQAVTRAERLVQRDAALRERQRLLVLVAHERHVGLVVDDAGEDVVGVDGHREPLALPECAGGFIGAARLREQHGRQRMHERKVPSIARRVERRRRLGEMLAYDSGVADLFVAVRELVMGEPDRPRVMGKLGVLQGSRVQRDGSRLLTSGERNPAVKTP